MDAERSAPPVPIQAARPRTRRLPSWRTVGTAGLAIVQCVLSAIFGFALAIGLYHGGLDLAPTLGEAAVAMADEAPRRLAYSPAVRARRCAPRLRFLVLRYVEKINEAWGNDWPFVIRLFEEFDARYPGLSGRLRQAVRLLYRGRANAPGTG